MTDRKPEWLRKTAAATPLYYATEDLLRRSGLAAVCAEAGCPNRFECYAVKRAAFLVMGPVCTRGCAFCRVRTGTPSPLDPSEPERIARAAAALGLRHVVVTSVTRDDLPDGGASHFVKIARAIKRRNNKTTIEILIPDFQGRKPSLRKVATAGAEVVNHNIETVPRLYSVIRPQANYRRSLAVLEAMKAFRRRTTTKSGLMLGLGETEDEVIEALGDLRRAGCAMVTLGQYLAPSRKHYPVQAYIAPPVFERYKDIGYELGFSSVAAGPFVRSSYQAEEKYLSTLENSEGRT
jgi:lipoic acid synthetase